MRLFRRPAGLVFGTLMLAGMPAAGVAGQGAQANWYSCWANVHSDGPPFSDQNLMLRLVTVMSQSTSQSETEVSTAWRDFVLEQPSSGVTRTFCRAFDAASEADKWRDSLLLGQAEDPRIRAVAWRLAGAAAAPMQAAQAPAPAAETGTADAAPAAPAGSPASVPVAAAPAPDPAALERTRALNQQVAERNAAIEAENKRRQEQYERELAASREKAASAQQAYQAELARARAAEEAYRRQRQAYEQEIASGKYQTPQ